MWAVFTIIGYFILALLIPATLALWPVWRRARPSRHVTCPASGGTVLINLDPWYAVRMHAAGNRELRVRSCPLWPAWGNCGQECIGRTGRNV